MKGYMYMNLSIFKVQYDSLFIICITSIRSLIMYHNIIEGIFLFNIGIKS